MKVADAVMDRAVVGRVGEKFLPLGQGLIELAACSQQVRALEDLIFISLQRNLRKTEYLSTF
ncbi:MAG: hypothetical protein C4293_12650 [Nitrospiraceae bacterium]